MIDKLKKLGLNGYEADVYITLVGLGDATAREISDSSSVPRPKVYDTIKSLEEKGFVEVQYGHPNRFRPMEPRKVIRKLENDTIRTAEECIHNLERYRLDKHDDSPSIWMVKGNWAVTTRVQNLISTSQKEILIEVFDLDFLNEISNYLDEIDKKITCIYIGKHEDQKMFPDKIHVNFVNIDDLKERSHFIGLTKFITEGIQSDGIMYEPEGNITVDEKVNIKIHKENGKRTAIVSKVPISAYIHKNIVETLLQDSKSK
ncbi:transcriptional regulator, TrmB [Methanohalobium evestigatum Z-7303]|uniref:Transcriptional regulator, TrmB n=1 Tax=Methanohalobium evestigatum (strain ATCC BAA-1072 / DSM 3721 / NBRC 107634 / OCM 161 / Z-7303) TaxID=644295 RepID=D7E7I7_METEZ|nr:TrmB family transcriptional regulator [Methanohalobium evestigatum]ADI74060.1 transcriptional regulator, TrmB [Methanohalobium evestigatum Z-7303]